MKTGQDLSPLEIPKHWNTKHGQYKSSEYNAWRSMRGRCYNKNNTRYMRYGGRGIIIEWNSFEEFFKDMGPKPSPEYSIDRINNAGNYSASNCRWATRKTQSNNRTTNHMIEYRGEKLNIKQLSEKLGIRYKTLHKRIFYYGWDVEKAASHPIKKN